MKKRYNLFIAMIMFVFAPGFVSDAQASARAFIGSGTQCGSSGQGTAKCAVLSYDKDDIENCKREKSSDSIKSCLKYSDKMRELKSKCAAYGLSNCNFSVY
ncbi:MAG: hypothetical protein LBB23_03690 [Rickettsiales bacterium]|jgi:hypothetical protein|nr:hypothetical protein [Rickettsiales bacterium]